MIQWFNTIAVVTSYVISVFSDKLFIVGVEKSYLIFYQYTRVSLSGSSINETLVYNTT